MTVATALTSRRQEDLGFRPTATGTYTLRVRSYRGLFGDAWLTCELATPVAVAPAALEERAGRWCAQVVGAVQLAG